MPSSSFRPAGDITLAGRRHRPAEVPKGTIQGHLWLPTASLRFHINMVPPTDPLGVRACPIDAFGGLGKAQWVRLPELCFYRKKTRNQSDSWHKNGRISVNIHAINPTDAVLESSKHNKPNAHKPMRV